ncbi:MAG: DUF1844 domain-containing protein [Candidatus Binatia bacterium]|nr:DUF1844 domain-containing protein [Candidatus Binatia bacterium]
MESEKEGQTERSFKVEDRRRFTATGDPRPEAEGTQPYQASGQASEEARSVGTAEAAFRMEAPPPPPSITFATFILSLSTQALAHLGEIPDPVTREVKADLAAASQMIDILAMLEQKTRGNLDQHEAQLLRGILYDLRLRYVEKAKA